MNIYIYCDGGFGNRFNVLLSGLYLADQIGYNPIVIWQPNNWCGAILQELFATDFVTLPSFDKSSFFRQPITALIHENQFGQQIDYKDPRQFDSLSTVKKYIESQPDQPVLYFTNVIPQWVDINSIITDILPKIFFHKNIESAAAAFCGLLNKEYYGIHLRMTDFAQRDNSLVSKYFELAKSMPDQQFFVCSDDAEVEIHFSQLANVFINPKKSYAEKLVKDQDWNFGIHDYNGNYFNFNVDRSSDSVKSALVDLIILSRSKIINTNPASTFLQTAFLLQKRGKINQ